MNEPDTNSSEIEYGPISLTVDNLGGIDHTDIQLEPGVSILTGRNATNRTSLLSALGGVLGGTTASLKSDAEDGYVTLKINGEIYRREYNRAANDVEVSGDAYSDDQSIVDLYVALLNRNPARQAVERDTNLREVIMRPVDSTTIEARIADLKQQRQTIENQINQVDERRAELPSFEERKKSLEEEIGQLDQELEELQTEVDEYEEDLEAAEDASKTVEELNSHRQELRSLSDSLEVKLAEREALQKDVGDVELELEELSDDTMGQLSKIKDDLKTAQAQNREINDTIASLTTIVDFNDKMLNQRADLPGISTSSDNVTSELAPNKQQEVICWTCGSQVQRGDINDRLDDLRSVIEEKRRSQEEIESDIDDLQDQRSKLEDREARKGSLERRLENMRDRVDSREQTIKELRSDRTDLEDDVEHLERKVAETEELRETDLLDKYNRISDLQYEQGQLQQQLNDIINEIEEVEALPEKSDLTLQRDELQEKLEDARSQISELETEAANAFNHHMNELLGKLSYENIARIWLERKQTGKREGNLDKAQFDLHIVRETSKGSGYEDQIENLSESESELIGLVVALSGYLVHNDPPLIPFMLVDSLEAIDAQRIADIVEYFAVHVPYLVLALLPEDAAVLENEYNHISADTLVGF